MGRTTWSAVGCLLLISWSKSEGKPLWMVTNQPALVGGTLEIIWPFFEAEKKKKKKRNKKI